MKVGIIGLGRMGEGMSRRMLKAGIEVYGYRRNYEKALEAKIDRLENLVLKLLEDKRSSKKKKRETSSSEASSEDSDL